MSPLGHAAKKRKGNQKSRRIDGEACACINRFKCATKCAIGKAVDFNLKARAREPLERTGCGMHDHSAQARDTIQFE